jgi:hypothetical protein
VVRLFYRRWAGQEAPAVSRLAPTRRPEWWPFLVWMLIPICVNACSMDVKQVVLTRKHKIVPDDNEANDHFGISVAMDGDRAVVGARGDDDRGAQAGSAYVFVRGAEGWVLESKVVAADGGEGELFGVDVALDGELLVVGSRGNIDRGSQTGSAYVFSKGGFGWIQEKKLAVSKQISNCCFGSDVSISGNVIVVGASGESVRGHASGAAYVFRQSELGLWLLEAKLIPEDASERDYFGSSVDIDGSRVVIGADGSDDQGVRSGSAYVFHRTRGKWRQEAKLIPGEGGRHHLFGAAVAISGERIIVGAYGDDVNGRQSGSAYVFIRKAGKWQEMSKLVPPGGRATQYFGRSVDIDGESVIVGAFGDGHSGLKSGAAYVYSVRKTGLVLQAKLLAESARALQEFGRSVAISNRRVVVGMHGDGSKGPWSGAALIQ